MSVKHLNLDIDPDMTANSDYVISSQKAIKTALGRKQNTLSQGTGITLSNNTINLAAATTSTLGGIKIGDGLQMVDNQAKVVSVVNQNGGGLIKFWAGTQQEYNNLNERDPDTIYLIRS